MTKNIHRRVFLVVIIFAWIFLCQSEEVYEKVICRWGDYISCGQGETIRVVDVIYGRVVGRNECGTEPKTNCTTPAFCVVSEKANGQMSSAYWNLNNLSPSSPDPCSGKKKYLIIRYKCGGWKGITPVGENFALKKPAVQSQTAHGGVASRAVDGKTTNRYDGGSCTHTDEETMPWWRVDLEQRVAVSHVKITNRKNVGIRLCGLEIRIGDTTSRNGTKSARCGQLRHIPSNQADVITCEPSLVGRYVTIVIPGDSKILTLCEVEVYGTSILGHVNLTGVQVIGSNLPYEGQVVLNGAPFCDLSRSLNKMNVTAYVTCLQLGYPRAISYGRIAENTIDSERKAVVKFFNCSGKEGSLQECLQIPHSQKMCLIQDTIKVRCQAFVRLRGSTIPLEGRVEVLHDGIWGTVHSGHQQSNWKKADARVVCRELGFYDVTSYSRSTYAMAKGKIWLKNVNCKGDEKSLVFCKHNNWKDVWWGHYYDVAVKCSICSQPLLQNKTRFPDSVFNTSSFRGADHPASSGRLYSSRPWCLPDSQATPDQFLEINLPAIFSLSAVATAGAGLGYVTSYALAYSVSGREWSYATINKQKVINGNTNNDTHNVIRRELDPPIYVERIRFIPKKWIGIPCMRVELCGIEIPRCQPSNIVINNLTSTAVVIKWQPLLLHNKKPERINYSVIVSGQKDLYHFKNTTENTFLLIDNLLPYHNYNYEVRAVGLDECFYQTFYSAFRTGEDVPDASPKNIKVEKLESTCVSLSWSPPDVQNQNGIITQYSICYSTDTLTPNCSSNGNISFVWTNRTSEDIKDLHMATIYFLRMRAYTILGPGPYSKEIKIVTGSGPVKVAQNINITSSSFGLRLQTPQMGFSYIQVIVVRLPDRNKLDPPHTISNGQISTVNESAGLSEPYITAEISASQFDQYQDFIIGDGKNYGRLSSRDNIKAKQSSRRKRNREDNSNASLFYNRPLEADSFYSAFQRTFRESHTFYSSSWSEPVKTAMKEKSGNSPMTAKGSVTWIAIGAGIGGVIVVALLLLLFVFIKRRKSRSTKSNESNVDASNGNIKTSPQYDGGPVYDNVVFDSNTEQLAMNTLAVKNDEDTDSETDAAGLNNEQDKQENLYGNAEVNETRDPFRMIPLEEFEGYVQDMKSNNNFGFEQQFKELPSGVCYPCTIAKSPGNKPMNRYNNIVSYDDALVPLSEGDGETYINASYIKGFEPKSYIATQGPMSKTVCAFWKMVWEQESALIIMLTNLKEKEKIKCTKYWPDTSKKYGSITVSAQTQQLFPYFILREFLVAKDDQKRLVTHFHFSAWPDHGVPKYPTQLLAFQNYLRLISHKTTSPIIVHCSAGVGRTGTFICIDHILRCLSQRHESVIDVFGMVQEMRKRRVNMIQTVAQYVLVHDAILEYILCGVNEIEGNYLEDVIGKLLKVNPKTEQTGFEELFQRLKNLSPVLTAAECKTATLKHNSLKNRTLDIYPADYARVTLASTSSGNGSDYINATFVDGYKQKRAYIATDSPLANTFDVFWQMINEQQSPLIIMLNRNKEQSEMYPDYFPTDIKRVAKYGNLFVRLDDVVADQTMIFRKFSISKLSDFSSSNIVRHFQYTQWPSQGIPTNSDDILQMINTIQSAQRQNNLGPMVVHCGNGAGRTGTFLTISICLERLKAEQRIDVFQCIKLIRERRPQFVESALQLQFCYEVLAKYVKSFEGYSNFE